MFVFVYACLPVKVVQGRPVLGHSLCQECRGRGDQGLVVGCQEAGQRSHKVGKSHLTLRHRDNLFKQLFHMHLALPKTYCVVMCVSISVYQNWMNKMIRDNMYNPNSKKVAV